MRTHEKQMTDFITEVTSMNFAQLCIAQKMLSEHIHNCYLHSLAESTKAAPSETVPPS